MGQKKVQEVLRAALLLLLIPPALLAAILHNARVTSLLPALGLAGQCTAIVVPRHFRRKIIGGQILRKSPQMLDRFM